MTPENPARTPPEIRETLFGDQELANWAKNADAGEPWSSFFDPKGALDRGNKPDCVRILRDIAERQGLESRHYIQAWHFLRQLGVLPAQGKAKDLYGVVVEVGVERGLDIVAAYADLHARYFNFSGAAIIWERPDSSLDAVIRDLLNAGQVVVNRIGPWTEPRPGPPPNGQVRLNMLTLSGLHFGQGPFQTLASDALGGPVIAAAMKLMQALIGRTKK